MLDKDQTILHLIHLIRLGYLKDQSTQKVLSDAASEFPDPLHSEIQTTLNEFRIGMPLLDTMASWQMRTSHTGLKLLITTLQSIAQEELKFGSFFEPVKALDSLFEFEYAPYPLKQKIEQTESEIVEEGPERITPLLKEIAQAKLGVFLGAFASEQDVEKIKKRFQIECMIMPKIIELDQAKKYPIILDFMNSSNNSKMISGVREIFGFRSGRALFQEIYSFVLEGVKQDGSRMGNCYSNRLVPSVIGKLEYLGYQTDRFLYMSGKFGPINI